MDRFTLQLYITVSMLGSVCHCWDAKVPETVNGIKKSCVLVPCSTDPYSKVSWYKFQRSGYPHVYSSDQREIIDEFKGRTSVPGSAEEGDCSLRIDNLQNNDGEVHLYVWVWKHGGNDKGFYQQTTKINLLEPQIPNISVQSPQVEGNALTAKCTFRTSCPEPPPQLSWLGLPSAAKVVSYTQNRDTLWDTEATATFQVTRRDQGTRLSCGTTLGGQSFQSVSVELDILYSPSILPGAFCSMENGSLKCLCQAEAKPNAVISWSIDGSNALVSPFNTRTWDNGSMTVSELTGPWGQEGNVKCTATNLAGTVFNQMHDHSKRTGSLTMAAGAGAAVVCVIIGLVAAIVICKKRRCAEQPVGLDGVQPVRSDKKINDYASDEDLSDEDLMNTPRAKQACKEQAAESCIYQNFGP